MARRSKKKIKQNPGISIRDLVGYVLVMLLGLAIVSIIYLAYLEKRHVVYGPNLCPVDGSLAEWTTRRADGLCDYGHSGTRSASHTWRGACPDGMRPLGGEEEKSMRPR